MWFCRCYLCRRELYAPLKIWPLSAAINRLGGHFTALCYFSRVIHSLICRLPLEKSKVSDQVGFIVNSVNYEAFLSITGSDKKDIRDDSCRANESTASFPLTFSLIVLFCARWWNLDTSSFQSGAWLRKSWYVLHYNILCYRSGHLSAWQS